ncbi:hypothetical protein [Embleya sp. NPDC005575]|uniref:hypothetical protein n=1 Tax=Embleya sp. NPDC005575 TaxID=3156892 RepID=UPI0033A62F7E
MAHLLGVNGLHTALIAHSRAHPDTHVLHWSTERDLFVLGEPDDWGALRNDSSRRNRRRRWLAIGRMPSVWVCVG